LTKSLGLRYEEKIFSIIRSMSKQNQIKEGLMGKRIIFLLILTVLVFALAGTSYAWQGRMGGMAEPYGLIADESDFLIHPAKIAKGQGVKFYGDYRFTYTGVSSWDYNLDQFTPAGILNAFYHYDGSGQEYRHNVLVGAAFPLGTGRMGLFFTYDRMRGDHDGNEDVLGMSNYANYTLTKDLDNFALRVLYGLPIGNFKLGGEAQFAYRQEENENWLQTTIPAAIYFNELFRLDQAARDLLPFQLPYDSHYWNALFKGSLGGKIGPLDLEFTMRGGFIFGADNRLSMHWEQPVGTIDRAADLDGGVTGWQIGGDLWVRYPLTKDFALPFLVRVDYLEKTRDGEGMGLLGWAPWPDVRYESEEKDLRLTVGGGVDKEFGTSSKIAAGLYYNYLKGENNIDILWFPGIFAYDSSDCPASIEHQVMLRLTGEHEFSPTVALRMGLNFFYGWVSEDYTFVFTNVTPQYTDKMSLDGSHWGIGASLGGTIKFKPITLEPFIAGGWQQYKVDGNGNRVSTVGVLQNLYDMNKSRDEWSIGGGFSVLFDLK
jgi:hypothetical protein